MRQGLQDWATSRSHCRIGGDGGKEAERLRDAVAKWRDLDVIVVGGSEATKAMKEATRSVPIVFSGPSYPVEEGLVGVSRGRAATSPASRWHSPTP
jgi:hypothetical protein